VNHAFIMGDDVHSIFPMFVQSYKLDDIHAHAGPPDAALARRLMEETHRFYPGTGGSEAAVPRASVTMH
jgi:hypothetical protein